jgi:endonuclease/exonuclease/phosphatase (EEP) superfamily protein YafD
MRDKVGYAVVKKKQTTKKRILPQNTVFNAEQSAIIEDHLTTIMAAENRTPTKNPKTQTIRKMLDHEGPRITLLWVSPVTWEYQVMKRPIRERKKR